MFKEYKSNFHKLMKTSVSGRITGADTGVGSGAAAHSWKIAYSWKTANR